MTSCSRVLWTDYMSIKVTCTKIHLNQSNPLPEYFGYMRSSHDSTLLVSPLVVAGIVIGLVLFLSCVTIIIGSLRKDGRERDWRLQNPSYDGISYAPSFGDLSSVCTGDMSPALDFASYLGLSVSYPDFPPRYDECVGPGTSGSYLPTDEPPPYSLEDPQQLPRELALSDNTEEIALRSLDNTENDLITPSLSAADLHDVSPSRTTSKTSQHLPIIPMDIQKSMASSTTLAS
ncbi:PREDICTED: protein BEAN1 isoform X2 [Nanorana parkeri]|uniref:protein BEAN1 isoform X2 n=1 Tax=Nanorana parkeri TaxID=125878 RepID=UPI000854717D|nr:PREDICTED: protein BEAN1 isoform X2 [Nanorana parkeri]